MNLVRLARMTGDSTLEARVESTIQAFSKPLSVMPSAFAAMMSAVAMANYPSAEVVLVGQPNEHSAQAMLKAIRKGYIPNKVVLWQTDELATLAAYTAGQKAVNGKATAYICQNFQCNLPTNKPEKAMKLLQEIR